MQGVLPMLRALIISKCKVAVLLLVVLWPEEISILKYLSTWLFSVWKQGTNAYRITF